MSPRELFKSCCFTISDNVPGQDKQFIKTLTSLGFAVKDIDPLVVEKTSLSAGDIEALLRVVNEAFEPKVGDDFEILEPGTSVSDDEESIMVLSPEEEHEIMQGKKPAFQPTNNTAALPSTVLCSNKEQTSQQCHGVFLSQDASFQDNATPESKSSDASFQDNATPESKSSDASFQGMVESASFVANFQETVKSESVDESFQDIIKPSSFVYEQSCEVEALNVVGNDLENLELIVGEADQNIDSNSRFGAVGPDTKIKGQFEAFDHNVEDESPYVTVEQLQAHFNPSQQLAGKCVTDLNGTSSYMTGDTEAVSVMAGEPLAYRAATVNTDPKEVHSKRAVDEINNRPFNMLDATETRQHHCDSSAVKAQSNVGGECLHEAKLDDDRLDWNQEKHNTYWRQTSVNRDKRTAVVAGSLHTHHKEMTERAEPLNYMESNSQISYPAMAESPKIDPGLPREDPYTIGCATLRVNMDPALQQGPDLLVVVGELFDNLHWDWNVDVRDYLPVNMKVPQIKHSFQARGGWKLSPLTFQLLVKDYDAENFSKAFGTLKEIAAKLAGKMSLVKSVVFTTSALYSNDHRAGADPNGVDEELIRSFTDNVYEFLESLSFSAGFLQAVIATGPRAHHMVHRVLESREQCINIYEEIGHEGRGKECDVCFSEDYVPYMLTCCKGNLCTDCQKQVSICPFCRKPFALLARGNQPRGYMNIKQDSRLRLGGHENHGCFVITYVFPSGQHGCDHSSLGEMYGGSERVAYLPANDQGREILFLLRVAFKRCLTFTVGDSHTTGEKGVVLWNGILHKTSLDQSRVHGYPDENYFPTVLRQLADKGVTTGSVSEEELRDFSNVYQILSHSGLFFDA